MWLMQMPLIYISHEFNSHIFIPNFQAHVSTVPDASKLFVCPRASEGITINNKSFWYNNTVATRGGILKQTKAKKRGGGESCPARAKDSRGSQHKVLLLFSKCDDVTTQLKDRRCAGQEGSVNAVDSNPNAPSATARFGRVWRCWPIESRGRGPASFNEARAK